MQELDVDEDRAANKNMVPRTMPEEGGPIILLR